MVPGSIGGTDETEWYWNCCEEHVVWVLFATQWHKCEKSCAKKVWHPQSKNTFWRRMVHGGKTNYVQLTRLYYNLHMCSSLKYLCKNSVKDQWTKRPNKSMTSRQPTKKQTNRPTDQKCRKILVYGQKRGCGYFYFTLAHALQTHKWTVPLKKLFESNCFGW